MTSEEYNFLKDRNPDTKAVMSPYEIEELKTFPDKVYYKGEYCRRKIMALKSSDYHDPKNRYRIKKHDHIFYRYEVLDGLGKGAFGDVYLVYDHRDKITRALKIIRSERRFVRQANTERNILVKLAKTEVPNSSLLLDKFMFREHPCFVFELYGLNLFQFMKLRKFKGLEIERIKFYAKQILQCLQAVHAQNIIHCDLKPENIVLTKKEESVKVIDFGSSCYVSTKNHSYIQSRYYRSPEIILALGYNSSIDIWSFACIIIEILTGEVIFPGSNESTMMEFFVQYLGHPDVDFAMKSPRILKFFMYDGIDLNIYINVPRKPKSFEDILDKYSPDLTDLIKKCLTWYPSERLTASEALQHKFFK
tara:strand:+ start:223 stop:1311 length:1089 start_codon:yes stop_codon:yes gene_type:complete